MKNLFAFVFAIVIFYGLSGCGGAGDNSSLGRDYLDHQEINKWHENIRKGEL